MVIFLLVTHTYINLARFDLPPTLVSEWLAMKISDSSGCVVNYVILYDLFSRALRDFVYSPS